MERTVKISITAGIASAAIFSLLWINKNVIKNIINMMQAQVSNRGLDLIKESEGLRKTAYLDVVGIPTIGYGHTKTVTMADVTNKKTITEVQAEELLRIDLYTAENAVKRYCATTPLNQSQFDALVSFVYNIGSGNFYNSTLLKKVKANPKDPSIAYEFSRWNKAKGKVYAGLTTRRKRESELYFS